MLFLKIPVFVGSITTIICGIFHFFLPRLYGWRKYLKTLPGDFRRGVLATNYFLGIILFSIGIFSYIVMAFINPDSVIFRVWMSMMVVMWFFRLLYHLKHPLRSEERRVGKECRSR